MHRQVPEGRIRSGRGRGAEGDVIRDREALRDEVLGDRQVQGPRALPHPFRPDTVRDEDKKGY